MLWLVWIALAIGLLAAGATLVRAALQGLAAWRSFKQLMREIGGGMDGLAATGDRVVHSLEAAGASGVKVERSLAQLQRSLRRLSVLRAALKDVRDSFGRVTSVYPRK